MTQTENKKTPIKIQTKPHQNHSLISFWIATPALKWCRWLTKSFSSPSSTHYLALALTLFLKMQMIDKIFHFPFVYSLPRSCFHSLFSRSSEKALDRFYGREEALILNYLPWILSISKLNLFIFHHYQSESKHISRF